MNTTAEDLTPKRGRPSRSLAEEIAATKERLRQLEERAREQAKAEKDRNQRAVIDLVKSEKLGMFHVDAWRNALPQIRSALKASSEAMNPGAGDSSVSAGVVS